MRLIAALATLLVVASLFVTAPALAADADTTIYHPTPVRDVDRI